MYDCVFQLSFKNSLAVFKVWLANISQNVDVLQAGTKHQVLSNLLPNVKQEPLDCPMQGSSD